MEDTGVPQGPGQSLPVPSGPLDAGLTQPPAMEAGEAGPPGKMTTTSKLPKGVDGSMMPIQGFAGAPGETYLHLYLYQTTCSSVCFMEPGVYI